MRSRSVVLLAAIVLATAWCQPLQGAEDKELIAVLDLRGVQAGEAETFALTDRLREEMLRTGRFVLVDRSQTEAVLNEQALQQSGCTEAECAVQVGRILGVQKIVTGKAIKISDSVWLVSGIMVDVESAQTLRAESVQHQGDFFALMGGGIAELAHKLAAPPVAAAASKRAGPGQSALRVTLELIGVYVGSNTFTASIDGTPIPSAAPGVLYSGVLDPGEHTFTLNTRVLGNEATNTAVFRSVAGQEVLIKITRWAAGVAGGYNVAVNGEFVITRLF